MKQYLYTVSITIHVFWCHWLLSYDDHYLKKCSNAIMHVLSFNVIGYYTKFQIEKFMTTLLAASLFVCLCKYCTIIIIEKKASAYG